MRATNLFCLPCSWQSTFFASLLVRISDHHRALFHPRVRRHHKTSIATSIKATFAFLCKYTNKGLFLLLSFFFFVFCLIEGIYWIKDDPLISQFLYNLYPIELEFHHPLSLMDNLCPKDLNLSIILRYLPKLPQRIKQSQSQLAWALWALGKNEGHKRVFSLRSHIELGFFIDQISSVRDAPFFSQRK